MTRAAPSTLSVAVGLVLVVAGCGSGGGSCDEQPEPSAIDGEELPVEIEPQTQTPGLLDEEIEAALPAPGRDPSVTEQVMYHLQWETMDMAGVIGRVAPGRCDGGRVNEEIGAVTRCTVSYEGIEVPWNVEITGTNAGGFDYNELEYESRPLAGVLTAEAVYERWAWHMNSVLDTFDVPAEARCSEIPDVVRVDLGEPTGYDCQDSLASCTDGEWSFRWGTIPVSVDAEGSVTFEGRD